MIVIAGDDYSLIKYEVGVGGVEVVVGGVEVGVGVWCAGRVLYQMRRLWTDEEEDGGCEINNQLRLRRWTLCCPWRLLTHVEVVVSFYSSWHGCNLCISMIVFSVFYYFLCVLGVYIRCV